jgi:hypothetical protein
LLNFAWQLAAAPNDECMSKAISGGKISFLVRVDVLFTRNSGVTMEEQEELELAKAKAMLDKCKLAYPGFFYELVDE